MVFHQGHGVAPQNASCEGGCIVGVALLVGYESVNENFCIELPQLVALKQENSSY